MRIFPRKPTEEEIVARARRTFAVSKGIAIFSLCVAALFVALLPKFLSFFFDMLRFMPEEEKDSVAVGLMFGAICGLFISWLIVQALQQIHHAIVYFSGDPQAKLLIKYHDALAKLAKTQTALNNPKETTLDSAKSADPGSIVSEHQ